MMESDLENQDSGQSPASRRWDKLSQWNHEKRARIMLETQLRSKLPLVRQGRRRTNWHCCIGTDV
jgi:hypothetical protein